MPYRHDDLESRRAALAAELADVRNDARSEARGEKEREIQARLAALAIPRARRPLPSLPLLPRLRVASPCTESWDAMVGDDRARHCSKCDKDVFDLSAMTSREVVELLRMHEALPEGGLPCVRFYRRKDGTILTADCLAGAPRRISVRPRRARPWPPRWASRPRWCRTFTRSGLRARPSSPIVSCTSLGTRAI